MKTGLMVMVCTLTLVLAQRVPNFLYITTPILKLDASVSGTLDEEDGQNFKDGSRLEIIQGRFTAGDVLEFDLTSEFDGYLTLYGPEKALVTYDDDAASSSDSSYQSTIITEVPTTGRYVLVVSGYSELDLGNYEVSARKLETVDDSELSIPAQLNGILTESDDVDNQAVTYDTFALNITEATTLTLSMTSASIDSYLKLYSEDGTLVAENDDAVPEDDPATSDVDEGLTSGLDALIMVDLEPGVYRLQAGGYTLGYYTLSVESE